MNRNSRIATLAVAAVSFGLGGAAQAELIYGLTSTGTGLVTFDSATPSAFTPAITITGVTVGTLRAIDFRPATGELYGLSYTATSAEQAQLYTINTTTGVATAVGGPITLLGSGTTTRVSIDFNPVVDRLRVVTGANTNYRLHPVTGAIAGTDSNLAYDAGDSNFGVTPLIGDVAYTNSVPGATTTTLYAYDYVVDNVATIGSVGGTPVSPNAGTLFSVGNSGGPVAFDAGIGFDISGLTGIAYLSMDEFDSLTAFEELYSIDLSTGLLTLLGEEIGVNLLDISVAPAPIPEPAALGLLPIAGLALARRRR